ncbi:MAG: hypothetical protein AAFU79_20255 [Myxococcota bacterium]
MTFCLRLLTRGGRVFASDSCSSAVDEPHGSFIVGGQTRGEPPRLFEILPGRRLAP